MTARRTAGHGIAIALSLMWTFASQAHLTAMFTPDMAAAIDKTCKGIHKAYDFTGMSDESVWLDACPLK